MLFCSILFVYVVLRTMLYLSQTAVSDKQDKTQPKQTNY